jgi:soluble lytic murein transglycosylase-like protein
LIALAVVIFTASPVVLAAPDLINNESEDVPTEVIAEVIAETPPVEAPKAEQRTAAEEVLLTPAPTPKPVVKHPMGCENYRELVSQYNWNVSVILQIMKAESSCNPAAVGDNYPIRGLLAPSCGLMQIRTIGDRPSCEALKDPATNIAWAYRIYQSQGYPAWTVCRTKVACY